MAQRNTVLLLLLLNACRTPSTGKHSLSTDTPAIAGEHSAQAPDELDRNTHLKPFLVNVTHWTLAWESTRQGYVLAKCAENGAQLLDFVTLRGYLTIGICSKGQRDPSATYSITHGVYDVAWFASGTAANKAAAKEELASECQGALIGGWVLNDTTVNGQRTLARICEVKAVR